MSNVKSVNPNVIPDPMLDELFKRVALILPALKFKYDGTSTSFTSDTAMKTRAKAPEGHTFSQRYVVEDGGKECGFIRLEQIYNRSSGYDFAYSFKSHLVSVQRNRGWTTTTKLDTAIRNVKRFFRAPTDGYMLAKRVAEAASLENGVVADLNRPIYRGNFLPHNVTTQVLLNAFLTNRSVDIGMADAARKKLATPEFDTALSEYYLAHWFSNVPDNKKLYVLRTGDSYSYFPPGQIPQPDPKSASVSVITKSLDEFAPEVQDRLSVLQLMKDTELVRDVGLRVSEDFFIVVI